MPASLNWTSPQAGSLSETLWVSGISGQAGTYIDAIGNAKDIGTATGLPGSYGDGSDKGKQPVTLPDYASRKWGLGLDAASDPYVLEFALPAGAPAATSALARLGDDGKWKTLASADCVSKQPYQEAFLIRLPSNVDASCANAEVVGFDADKSTYWARLNRDGAFGVIPRALSG